MQDILEQLEKKRDAARLGGGERRIEAGLRDAFRHDPQVKAQLPQVLADVEHGRLPASTAARQLLARFRPGPA